jgi:hypothetical protein
MITVNRAYHSETWVYFRIRFLKRSITFMQKEKKVP